MKAITIFASLVFAAVVANAETTTTGAATNTATPTPTPTPAAAAPAKEETHGKKDAGKKKHAKKGEKGAEKEAHH